MVGEPQGNISVVSAMPNELGVLCIGSYSVNCTNTTSSFLDQWIQLWVPFRPPSTHHDANVVLPKAGGDEMLSVNSFIEDLFRGPAHSCVTHRRLISDWTLLDANLRFVFTDPVLTYHLKEQAGDLIGRTLQEFIHPDERESASKDLALVIQQQAIHGTVTRYVQALFSDYLTVLRHCASPVLYVVSSI